ncbi:MAG: cytochrome c biogenesis protein CcdA [Candidatus Omnitrophota bacterium]
MNINPEEISLISYLFAYIGGLVTSFTPCVYPLIPITVAFIGASSSGNRLKGFILSLAYVLGIAITYSALGAIAALTGSLFGEISTNPWTYLVIGNIFLVMALSLLGFFEIPIPGFLKSSKVISKRAGIIGAFLVGVSAGMVIGPCTAPALGAVLTYVGSKQNLFFGISLLFTFALGLGTMLIIIGTFAGIAASLPRSGNWLNRVKIVFGILLIVCAEYFIILAGKRFF